jgi:hypothetical protein
MNALRAAIGLAGLALLGLIVWACLANQDLHGTFGQQLSVLMTLPFGMASLADLYLGFALFAVVVFLTERSWIVALLWAAPVLILGNIWSALWFVVRLPYLVRQLRQAGWPNS